ncbi:conserved hypothetical protein [Haloferula helveola]|uniref:DUF4432 domain-containing protein n=1 Tax=Haloferula helveola TaxID=490095 RepID=A0ABM7RF37_9BACT|nr:conserved hypothetical protein [Haloferula helveola]
MDTVHGAESWRLDNGSVSLAVTREGGMIAPVEFRLGDRTVSPYSLSPWKPDEVDAGLPALLRVLRGDFFCLPFGPQEEGLPHGEPANLGWTEVTADAGSLTIRIEASDSGAAIEREISLRNGESAIYYDTRISGLDGEWSYGNHPILDASEAAEGQVRLSVSPFRWASVYPGVFSDPERGERQMLRGGSRFDELCAVSLDHEGSADLTRYPTRQPSDDLVMMVSEEPSPDRPFAWSAAVFDGYVWFSLKNPADFPATLFWLSNGGRDGEPWNGRHKGRVGIEEVCSHFCDGVDVSRQNLLADFDIPTVRAFRPEETVSLRIVQAVAEVPGGFGKVEEIVPAGDGKVRISDDNGLSVETQVDWSFVL